MEVTGKTRKAKKGKKKVMGLTGLEPGTFSTAGLYPNHYTTVQFMLKVSIVIFMFFPNACHF